MHVEMQGPDSMVQESQMVPPTSALSQAAVSCTTTLAAGLIRVRLDVSHDIEQQCCEVGRGALAPPTLFCFQNVSGA